MNIKAIAKYTEKLVSDNTPLILTTIGVTGALTTAFLTGKASFKAAEVIRDEQLKIDLAEKGRPLEFKDNAELVWKLYIPAVVCAGLTVTAIISANRIGTRRAAALASAYSISEKAFVDYKEKVLDKIGEKKELEVRDAVAQDRISKNPPSESTMIITEEGYVPCLDTHSGRYFKTNMQLLEKAQLDTNFQILHDDYASLSDYWERIGLPKTDESDEIGWNSDAPLVVEYATALTESGKPCITASFRTTPIRNYHRVH